MLVKALNTIVKTFFMPKFITQKVCKCLKFFGIFCDITKLNTLITFACLCLFSTDAVLVCNLCS